MVQELNGVLCCHFDVTKKLILPAAEIHQMLAKQSSNDKYLTILLSASFLLVINEFKEANLLFLMIGRLASLVVGVSLDEP